MDYRFYHGVSMELERAKKWAFLMGLYTTLPLMFTVREGWPFWGGGKGFFFLHDKYGVDAHFLVVMLWE